MPDTKVSALAALAAKPAGADELEITDKSDTSMAATGTNKRLLASYFVDPSKTQGRLTLESGVPISSTDQTAKSNVYFTPLPGAAIALYDGTNWFEVTFSEIAIVLASLTSAKNYDVFAFASVATPSSTNTGTEIVTFGSATGWVTGSMVVPETTVGGLTGGTTYFYNAASSTTGSFHTTLANAIAGTSKVDLTASITTPILGFSMELSAAWTNDTTRADAITTVNGVSVKSGTTTRKLLGTIRTTGTTTTEDSGGGVTTQVGAKRFVWNYYNRTRMQMKVHDTTDTWNYASTTIRQANGNTGNKIEFVNGDVLTLVRAELVAAAYATSHSGTVMRAGVGLDSTTTLSTPYSEWQNSATTGAIGRLSGVYRGRPGIGYHYLSWNEASSATGTNVFLGDDGGNCSSALIAEVEG